MRAPITFSDVVNATGPESQSRTQELVTNAMNMAGQYLQGLKTNAGGREGVPMKTMTREQMDQKALADYYQSQGLVAPATSTDPSAQIRDLSKLYSKTEDPAQQDLLHQQALKLAQGAGWLKPGEEVESVGSMTQMTNAGLPDPKYRDALIQQFFDNQIKKQNADAQTASANRSGGAAKEPTDTEIAKAIEGGIVDYTKRLISNNSTVMASRGLDKGKTFQVNGVSPEVAVEMAKNKLKDTVGNGLSYSQYVSAMKAVYLAVGLNPPNDLGKEE